MENAWFLARLEADDTAVKPCVFLGVNELKY